MFIENVDWISVRLRLGSYICTHESFSINILSLWDNSKSKQKIQVQTFFGCTLNMFAHRSLIQSFNLFIINNKYIFQQTLCRSYHVNRAGIPSCRERR